MRIFNRWLALLICSSWLLSCNAKHEVTLSPAQRSIDSMCCIRASVLDSVISKLKSIKYPTDEYQFMISMRSDTVSITVWDLDVTTVGSGLRFNFKKSGEPIKLEVLP